MTERELVSESPQIGAEELSEIRTEFELCDLDKTGRLDIDEFYNFIRRLTPEASDEEIEIGFLEIDTSHNGFIDFDEFLSWWEER